MAGVTSNDKGSHWERVTTDLQRAVDFMISGLRDSVWVACHQSH
jgi:hypothetical protein